MIKTALALMLLAVISLTDYVGAGLIALTDMQLDKILDMIAAGMRATGAAIGAVWVALSPFLLGYLAIRQAMNRKALDENTKLNVEAIETANGHNEKIATAVSLSLEAIKVAKETPQKMEVVGTVETHVTQDKP